MGVIIGDSLESYSYEEYKADQYSSLLKIDEADNLLPPSEAQQETCKICCDDHKSPGLRARSASRVSRRCARAT